MRKILLFLVLCGPSLASATVFLRPMGTYSYAGSSDGSTSGGTTRVVADLGVGYMSEKNWVYGFLYQIDAQGTGSRTSMGPSFGWSTSSDNGAFLIGHYFFKSGYGGASNSGWGYQADLGLRVALRRVHLAVQISYKSYTDKFGIDDEFATKSSYIDPTLGLIVSF